MMQLQIQKYYWNPKIVSYLINEQKVRAYGYINRTKHWLCATILYGLNRRKHTGGTGCAGDCWECLTSGLMRTSFISNSGLLSSMRACVSWLIPLRLLNFLSAPKLDIRCLLSLSRFVCRRHDDLCLCLSDSIARAKALLIILRIRNQLCHYQIV